MFESFKINIAALDALTHEYPMPQSVSKADCSQDFTRRYWKLVPMMVLLMERICLL